MTAEQTALGGMTAIREYCRILGVQSSEASVMHFIICCEFPARKLNGQWISDKEEICFWYKRFIRGEIPEKQPDNAKNNCKKNANGRKGKKATEKVH